MATEALSFGQRRALPEFLDNYLPGNGYQKDSSGVFPVSLDGVVDMLAFTPSSVLSHPQRVKLNSYYRYGTYNGSEAIDMDFVWDSTALKSGHNGVTKHSNTVPWDGTQATLEDYQSGVGETDPTGTGCWVLKYERMHVRMGGAVTDGTVDDTVATKACLNVSGAIFITGILKITENLNFSAGQWLLGYGPTQSKILVSGDGYDAITLSSSYASISSVRIYCNSARGSGAFVNLNSATHDNHISYFDFQLCFEGITITGGATSTFISKGRIAGATEATGIGIRIAGGNDTFISDLLINTASGEPLAGINIQSTDAVWLSNIDIINSGTPILVNPDSALGQHVAAIFASQVACDKSDGSAFKISPKGTAVVKWVFLDNCWLGTCDRGLHIEAEAGASVDGVFFNGGTIYNHAKQGAFVDTTNGTIRNIFIDGSRVGGNSTSSTGGYAGIEFGNNLIAFGVRNTRSATHAQLTNKQSYGILVGTVCNSYTLLGNDVSSNVTGGILDNSASTSTLRVVDNNNGHVTRKNANSAITTGTASVTVTHGLNGTPKTVIVTPQANLAGTTWYVNNIGLTTFDIRTSAAVAGNTTFSWEAKVY